MKSKYHVVAGIVATVIVCILQQDHIPFIIVATMFGATAPDLDIPVLGLGKHRNRFFHSCLYALPLTLYCYFDGSMFFSSAFAVGVMVHLILDLKPAASAQVAAITRQKWIVVNVLGCIPAVIWWL